VVIRIMRRSKIDVLFDIGTPAKIPLHNLYEI